jgi:hypothetical protein
MVHGGIDERMEERNLARHTERHIRTRKEAIK